MPFRFGMYADGMLQRRRGQRDLLYRTSSDICFLAVTVETPEPTPEETQDYVGVDLGMITLAATSDGEFLNHSTGPKHAHVNQVRARCRRLRQKLQRKGTKSAKRLLRKRSGRERRFVRDVNQCLSKAIVQTAQGTARGIALEDLKGIRERINAQRTVRRQRRVLNGWAFAQLRACIAYKAQMAGVRVVLADPAYTSQRCSHCGHGARANRPTQAQFLCVGCGYACHADLNAVENIRRAAVIRPHASARAVYDLVTISEGSGMR